jgi:formylglycine-generating enzyme required for sulfatase activity
MKRVRNKLIAGTLSLIYILSACSTPTPIVVVVTATPPPPTEPVVVETATEVAPAQVVVAGPQSGDKIKWVDGSTLVYVPPSEFVMGNDGFDAPIHNVTLEGYWIQQTKVTNRMYAQCVSVGSCIAPTQELGGPVYSNPDYANHPVVGITWTQANAFCAWSLGRLPTEAEWEKAARGLNANIYPWGNDEPACDILNFGYCSGRTSEVDAFLNGASFYGLYDMAGNVFEWVGDWYEEGYYTNSALVNPMGPESGQYRSIRGSSFETDPDQADSAIRHYGAEAYHSRDLGFRCVVPKPQPMAPYCQLSAYIPAGAIVSNGCELPQAEVAGNYCAGGQSIATVDLPAGAIYDAGSKLNCTEAVVDGERRLTCVAPTSIQETTNQITVCNPTCSNSPTVTGAGPTCDPGYTLDGNSGMCNYTPIINQLTVAGCPAGYLLADRGGQQTCILGLDANGQCAAGLYFDSLAGACVPPNGNTLVPYGIDNPTLAIQNYAGCATGYSYNDTFQCCQAVTGNTYPGCAPGSTFNTDLGACSPGEIKLSGPGCVTLDVTTYQCEEPKDVCSHIRGETRCINNAYACRWNEDVGECQMK